MTAPKSKPVLLIPEPEQQHIVAAIKRAETATTGEIRVYVESTCAYVDAMERAKEVFAHLEMHKTEKRNAALVYVAVKDKQFALFGDEAIYTLAGGPAFWNEAAHQMIAHFKTAQYGLGIAAAVTAIGEAMAVHFPYDPAVPHNELPDDIVFGT